MGQCCKERGIERNEMNIILWALIPIWIMWLVYILYCIYMGLHVHQSDCLKSIDYALRVSMSSMIIVMINLIAVILLKIIR